MTEKSNEVNQNHEFKQIIENYSDQELRKVLKKRNLYQKEAAEFAIGEAIKRGLIFSEQDLFASEFQPEPQKFMFFPVVDDERVRSKFRKSVARSLAILGVLPMVFGGINIFRMQSPEGILIFLFGAAWCTVSLKLMRSVNMKLINVLFLLLLIITGYFVKIFVTVNFLKITDVMFATVVIAFTAYSVGFLSRLKE